MKHWNILICIGLFLFMPVSVARAVEVHIMVIGQGYILGEKDGTEWTCATRCTENYDKGTVVQFKAIPMPDSTFAGWKINGASHSGTLTIEEDSVVSAVFALTEDDPFLAGDTTVYWYSGNGGREYAMIGLDEMVIQFEETQYWDHLSDEAYHAAVQSFVTEFHEQATIRRGIPGLLTLKSPEPLTKEQWFTALNKLQAVDDIRWAGPMLYRDSEDTWGKRIVGNKIYVDFPQMYSEEQIKRIEQEYHLKRVHTSATIPNSFTYQAEHPLAAIELANRLYESGLVECSEPDIPDNVVPTSEPSDKLFNEQWHLKNALHVGEDINVLPVWDKYKGDGVVIGVVDDGVEFAHPDLLPNKMLPESEHHDYIEGDDDPIDNNRGMLANGVTQIEGSSKPKICASGCHGTAVAGISAAEGFRSEIGVTGVAPFAKLIGYRRYLCDNIDTPQQCIYSVSKGSYEGILSGGKNNNIDVYNNSWGCGNIREEMDNKLFKEMRIGTTQQNIIYVFSAGNIKYFERNVDGKIIRIPTAANTNYCGETNTRYSIAVGASAQDGAAHDYSVPGATVLVNASSGLHTTDRLGIDGYSTGAIQMNYELLTALGTICHLPSDFYAKVISSLSGQSFENKQALFNVIETTAHAQQFDSAQIRQNIELISACNMSKDYFPDGNYYTGFSGTSAAAPVVSGIVALMIDARKQSGKPQLSWRDVQHILIKTAHKNLGGPGEALEQEWQNNTNAAGYSHLDKYGFGRVDAAAAVKLAETWESLPREQSSRPYSVRVVGLGNGFFTGGTPVEQTFHVQENFQVEFVEVTFSSPYPRWSDLEIELISPGKTKSILAQPIETLGNRSYNSWIFGSRRHFGEASSGDWVIRVRNQYPDGKKSARWFLPVLKVYGAKFPPGLPFTGVYGMKNTLPLDWRPTILPTRDDGYVLLTATFEGPLLLKLDSAGGIEWAKALSGGGLQHIERVGTFRATEAALTAFSQAGFSNAAAALRIALGSKTYASPSLFTHLARRAVLPFGEEALAALPIFLHRACTETGWVLAGNYYINRKSLAWVVKFNTAGKLVWQYAYDLLPDCQENCSSHNPSAIHATNDGGLLLVGYLANASSDRGWLMKLDANGVPAWHTRSEENVAWNDVVETDDERLVVTGAGYGLLVGAFSALSGLPIEASWRQYPIGGGSWGNRLIRADDGGFLVQGGTMGNWIRNFREWDVVAAKFDAGVQPIWINQYGVADFDEAYTLVPSGPNGTMIGGGLCVNRNVGGICFGTQSAWWLRLDEEGLVIGSQTRTDAAYGTIFSLGHTGDGGYVAAGYHAMPRFGLRNFVIKTGGADALFEHPKRSCFDAGNPPDVQARPVAMAPVPLDLHVQHATSISYSSTASRTTIKDALTSLSLEVDLCLRP